MSKRYNRAEIDEILRLVVSNGFSIIEHLGKELSALDVKEEDFQGKERTPKALRASLLMNTMAMINDMIHPAHKYSLRQFPASRPFVEECMRQYKLAVDQKMFKPCRCCNDSKVDPSESDRDELL